MHNRGAPGIKLKQPLLYLLWLRTETPDLGFARSGSALPLSCSQPSSCHKTRRLKGLSLPFPWAGRFSAPLSKKLPLHAEVQWWKLLNFHLERTLASSTYVNSLCTHSMTGMLLQEDAWPVRRAEQPLLFSTRALEFIAFSSWPEIYTSSQRSGLVI